MTLKNHGVAYCTDGKINYTVNGGIMSGDIDTSLKGCLIMCSMVKSWLQHCGVRAKLINNGDDCVLFCNDDDRVQLTKGMTQYFSQVGIDVVAEPPVYEVERVEFCQAKPVRASNDTYIMCRNPFMASSKDSMTTVDISDVHSAKAWAGAVSDCGLALAGDMPVFAAYYGTLARYSDNVRKQWMADDTRFTSGLRWYAKGMIRRSGVTDETRISFWRAWGILPHEQRAIEEYYDEVRIGDHYEGPVENLSHRDFHAPLQLRYLSNGKELQTAPKNGTRERGQPRF